MKWKYALKGSVFVVDALIKWLRNELGIIKSAHETKKLAKSVEYSAGVMIVPAFVGLLALPAFEGLPRKYWRGNYADVFQKNTFRKYK